MLRDRAAGVLLPVFSLPSRFGIGDFGKGAYDFIDKLKLAGQCYWQILPLNPTPEGINSPYSVSSAFAGNPLLISPDVLCGEGLLEEGDFGGCPVFDADRVEYDKVSEYKEGLLRKAYGRLADSGLEREFEEFCEKEKGWLNDYCMFKVFKGHFGGKSWAKWPGEIKRKEETGVAELVNELADETGYRKFEQFLFFRQWENVRQYAFEKELHIIGDLPYYVDFESADVWGHPDAFKLDEDYRPRMKAGVPPDFFNEEGQLWGNPVYDWKRLGENGFAWWMDRIEQSFRLYDVLRVDHFRGFVDYWQVPGDVDSAKDGEWVDVPAEKFFQKLFSRWPFAPMIAEDLGEISARVREVISMYGFTSVKVLLFAFENDSKSNPHSVFNHVRNSVVYTGTHDNNTARGWFKSAGEERKERLRYFVGGKTGEDDIAWEMIKLAYGSVSNLAVIPLQDVLNLDERSRINYPGEDGDNWRWRFRNEQFTDEVQRNLKELVNKTGRY